MKKIAFHVFMLMLGIAILAIAFTSCNSDDDPIVIPVFDSNNPCYKGETEINYTLTPLGGDSAKPGVFTSEETKYNLVLDEGRGLATVNIIDAVFAPGMPKLTLRLEGLTYNLQNGTVTGTNMDVKMLEGGSYTPYPDMVFTSFKATFGDALHSKAEIIFSITGTVGGRFTLTGDCTFNSTGIVI